MNKNILAALTVVVGLAAADLSWAGKGCCPVDGAKSGMKANKEVEHITKKLKLTNEQKAKVQEIMLARAPKAEETHQQMADLRESTNKEIEAILTPEQKEKFQKMTKGGKDCCGGKDCAMKK